jgi:DNA (cytosine-5)-methyltransferase 3A
MSTSKKTNKKTVKKINVVSLFDGASGGQLALKDAKIPVGKYYASEINPQSIEITQHNFPKTIQLGDVTKIKGKNLKNIFLLCAGSPCQDLSRSNTKGKGLKGDKSSLFYHVVRLIKEVKPKYFFVENVLPRNREDVLLMNEALGVEGILIDSNLVSAQNRERIYWTNIPFKGLPKNRFKTISDILDPVVNPNNLYTHKSMAKTKKLCKSYYQWDQNGKENHSQFSRAYFPNGKCGTVTRGLTKIKVVHDMDKNLVRILNPNEVERLQMVPKNYTKIPKITDNQRIAILGDGWTIGVISWFFKQIPGLKSPVNKVKAKKSKKSR